MNEENTTIVKITFLSEHAEIDNSDKNNDKARWWRVRSLGFVYCKISFLILYLDLFHNGAWVL